MKIKEIYTAGVKIFDNYKSKINYWVFTSSRIIFGILWLQNAWWKEPPTFGYGSNENLYYWVSRTVEYPVFAPFTWFIKNIVLTHFIPFAWIIYITEILIGLSLVTGYKSKIFTFIAFLMSINIALSVSNTPGEWFWSYIMMIILSCIFFIKANE